MELPIANQSLKIKHWKKSTYALKQKLIRVNFPLFSKNIIWKKTLKNTNLSGNNLRMHARLVLCQTTLFQ